MSNTKSTNLSRYGVSNVSKLEEFAHISRPDKYSPVYHEFIELISYKVGQLAKLLTEHNIQFSSNEFINGHLYRIYIPEKDLLFDFENYPVINYNYNYIRINYFDDISEIFNYLYPKNIIGIDDIEVWQLTQKANNRFLRANGYSSIYDKYALRLALVRDNEIYKSMSITYDEKSKHNKIISNATSKEHSVEYGTVILLNYFKNFYDITNIELKSNLDNSFRETAYQLMGMKVIDQQCKKKIWWSPIKPEWHIKKEHIDEYVPYYFTEKRIWLL